MTRPRRPFIVQRAVLPGRAAKRLVLPLPSARNNAKRRRERFARAIAAAEFSRRGR